MIKRKKVSPVKFMMNHWIEIPGLKGDVGYTSLVTHIAKNLGLLEDASVSYIDVHRWLIYYDYFNHSHMLKGKRRETCHDVYGLYNRVPITKLEPQFVCSGFACL